jgi:hypothetical protein
MYRAFEFTTDAGAYWSVIDDGTYETSTVADRFLQYVRFGRGRAESTTRKYAEGIALYLTYCARCGVEWTEPDLTAFQMWLRVTPPLRRSAASTSSTDSLIPVRGNNHINLISYAVGEMFKIGAAEGLWPADRLGTLFETAQVRIRAGDRRDGPVSLVVLRRRHRLRKLHSRRRDAPVDFVKALIGACRNSRDVFALTVLATTGLRRGELLGLRLSDLHLAVFGGRELEGVDVAEVVGEDVDEGPGGVAGVEPNPAEQLTMRAANVPVGIVPDLDAGQLNMRRELLGEVDVFDEADLLIEPSSDFLLADGRAEQVVRQLDLIAQRRPTSESFHPTQHSHPPV